MEPNTFWVNPFGTAWPLLKSSDLIRVNDEGKVVEGGQVKLLNLAGTWLSLLRWDDSRLWIVLNMFSIPYSFCCALGPP